ncbi:hypothetical protein BDW59DRAFT_129908 [Aspergillus cavernicola]|uniref:HTH APSES-type domain-containing protein n=1 Tax=Aspergillus cavernicola TaxID=176166 RepID=A0ABR4HTC7_9EURO
MASIESLLNPLPNLSRSDRFPLPTPSPSSPTSTVMLRAPRQKKQKMAKDAPVFNRGRTRGEVRYPPDEERDEQLASLHRDFRIHPFGNIADYPRHIPYNSDKKLFQALTGRENFEVFQYTFQLPGEEKQWTVMWDYNIGLVRTTHLFKCNEYSKTTPAKMLNLNPGLRDVCHSITGGALAAQGYWMPFEAAKAVAATFCWKIRFALTPLFGVDFPALCIPPNDRPRFGRMVIDPTVVRTATERANFYRMLELHSPPLHSLRAPECRPSSSAGDRVVLGRHILPKSHHHHHHPYPHHSDTSTDRSIGYGSSPEYSSSTDPYCISPVSPLRNVFTPVNTPRSTDMYSTLLPSPHQVLASLSTRERARARAIPSSVPSQINLNPITIMEGSDADTDAETDLESGSDESTSETLYSAGSSTLSTDELNSYPDDDNESYCDSDADMDGHVVKRAAMGRKRRRRVIQGTAKYEHEHEHRGTERQTQPYASRLQCEVRAAHALLSLHMQDAIGSDVNPDIDNDSNHIHDKSSSNNKEEEEDRSNLEPRRNPNNACSWNGRKRRRASV